MGDDSVKDSGSAGVQQDLPDRTVSEAPAAAKKAPLPPKGGKQKSKKAPEPDAPLPDFIIERNNLFEELWQKHKEEHAQKPRPDIAVTLDVGDAPSTVPAKAWQSTPGSFLKDLPKEISSTAVVAKVDGKELWDLDRPLERDCTVSYLPFDSAQGREVFWHSSAHVLGEACECQYGCMLSHGPPTAQGFFYDMAIPDGYVGPQGGRVGFPCADPLKRRCDAGRLAIA